MLTSQMTTGDPVSKPTLPRILWNGCPKGIQVRAVQTKKDEILIETREEDLLGAEVWLESDNLLLQEETLQAVALDMVFEITQGISNVHVLNHRITDANKEIKVLQTDIEQLNEQIKGQQVRLRLAQEKLDNPPQIVESHEPEVEGPLKLEH